MYAETDKISDTRLLLVYTITEMYFVTLSHQDPISVDILLYPFITLYSRSIIKIIHLQSHPIPHAALIFLFFGLANLKSW